MAKEVNERLLLKGELAELEEKEPKLRAEFKEKANKFANLTLSFVRLPVEECNTEDAETLIKEMAQLQEEVKKTDKRIQELKKKLGV